jgi:hypothetical protein
VRADDDGATGADVFSDSWTWAEVSGTAPDMARTGARTEVAATWMTAAHHWHAAMRATSTMRATTGPAAVMFGDGWRGCEGQDSNACE